ncbi:hypothetical protein [Corynebacterium aquilae]|uniref:Uncharacterized protein n=1 Tax=Corynebacterium aquilae DSM 44791 TaxID=1431546 RepID=A0A1L7CHL0_9CORY|nr:hypothetical protein [Corynebacterium aquilae]APT85334.1 hypothetical protein CAQU_09965 [Corynebacterium aquilae DSM 44791]
MTTHNTNDIAAAIVDAYNQQPTFREALAQAVNQQLGTEVDNLHKHLTIVMEDLTGFDIRAYVATA